ncbi:hypothetical protein [Roseovarius sp. D22-M7]|uniref:hypothetical protein n=1 Tax=Roseovarius sp. D22-M7 TaxID=3127116 RepID=UPI00300F824F
MTSKPAQTPRIEARGANGWREIVQAGAEGAGTEGLALEHLIDLQRAQARQGKDVR